MEYTPKPQPSTLLAAMADLGLTVHAEFVPWSRSRNVAPNTHAKDRSLNWKVTVKRGDVTVLTTDYQAGIGHCPSYRPHDRWTLDYTAVIETETETGRTYTKPPHRPGPTINPKPADVVYSLTLDASVLDYATFEDWASDLGYDPDSRKAEAAYRTCLEIALKLRVALGEDGLKRLRDACEDY